MQSPVSLLRFSGRRRLPVIHQTEMAECGLACLAMISGYHGHQYDLVTLRRRFPVSLKGATLKSLMDTADDINLTPRALRVELDQLTDVKTPAILHWDMNHFVVLRKAGKQGVVIHDPAHGKRELDWETVSRHFTGIVLELTPTKAFEIKNEKLSMRLSDFWDRITGFKRALAQILVLSFALQIFALGSPFYMQLVVDDAVVSHDSELLSVLALGFLLLMLIEVTTRAFRSYVILIVSNTLNIQMANNLFRHLIRLPMAYFENRHIGDTVSRFGSLESVRDLLTTGFVEAIVDGLMSLILVVLLFLYSPKLAVIVLLTVFIFLMIRLALFRPFRNLNEEAIVAAASEQSNFMESVRGIQSIKLFGKEVDRQTLWQNRYADVINTGIRLGKFRIGFDTANGVLFGVENIVVIYLGADLILENALTVGMLYAFVSYKRQFTEKANTLIDKVIEFKMIRLHLERIADIAQTPTEKSLDSRALTQHGEQDLAGKLQLQDIAYRYSPNDPFLFQGLDLTVRPGEVIAIVGPSGCGKTTLLKIMLGLLEPGDGALLVDGQDLEKVGLRQYRSQIAAVMQNDQLMSGNIADNISFFDPEPNQSSIEECAQWACIHDDILAMPMGYNSLVGDMGTTLSGGQKQRLLLARALYQKPRILFLDEATSHLDSATEDAVNANLRKLDITRIMIAHREATINMADRVVVLQGGQLQEIAKN
ncbi:peptidase domain-containing ABC transporter [Marinobacter sp. HL-58]|uniref:peptidase domain-containing ABC transporter n=1 Tax=Marinobacter sp. HL-58 TaxID=1479237 RepID=UPI00047F4B9B|nr:peptidase domain-containing ABC transporter [Marinobacter sp. HL-58]KPQ00262.1 MAG: type I bacteriocin secretion system ATPase and cysteine peptidase component RaxB [Marinobacter sp. HL-58]